MRKLIEQDRRVRKFKKLFIKGKFKFDCKTAIKEIRILHRDRLGRQLKVSDVLHKFQSSFLNSVLQAQANRSRIVEIKMQAFQIHAALEKHTSLLKKHLRSNYFQQLNRISGTAVDRDAILDVILNDALAHIKDLKTTMDISDLAINDLDQVGWSAKNVIKIMEAVSEKRTAKF